MTPLRRGLLILISLEIVAMTVFAILVAARPKPPHPNLDRQPDSIAADFRRLEQVARSDRPQAWREYGEALLSFGYFVESEACFRRAAAQLPRDFGTQFGWAYALDRLGRLVDSNERFQAAAALANEEMARTCWYHIGRNLLRLEDPKSAELAFMRINGFAAADYQRANVLLMLGRPNDVTPLLWQLDQAVPNSIHVQHLTSKAARAAQDDEAEFLHAWQAERASDNLSLTDHFDYMQPIRVRYGDGRLLSQMEYAADNGQIPLAAQLFDRIVSGNPPDQTVFMVTQGAELKWQAGHTDEAVSLITQSEKHRAFTPPILHLLGRILKSQGKHQEARAVWERASRLQPEAATYDQLSEICDLAGQSEESKKFRSLARLTSGIAEFRQNNVAVAQAELEESLKLNSQLELAWFYLGDCHKAAGNNAEAHAAYERCLALNENFGRAISRLNHANRPMPDARRD